MSAGRAVWVKVRASDAERAEWHAKARFAGLTLSDLVRRSLGRSRTWTVPHAKVERERTREAARIGNNLNQIARWANTHKGAAEAVEVIEVLRGNPHMVAAVADPLDFEHRYTSGVIAWAPDDQPTDEQIEAVLDAFEDTAWAGLERDRYAWTAVLHREEDGGAHVHVLAARCDLETGRSLNIAPPGWRKTFDPLRDAFNHEHGWSRPDDPARARVEQPGHRAYIEAARLHARNETAGATAPANGAGTGSGSFPIPRPA